MSGIKSFFKPEEMAKKLGMSVEVLLSWRSHGMPVIKKSKYIFIDEQEFCKWMRRKTEPEEKPKESKNE